MPLGSKDNRIAILTVLNVTIWDKSKCSTIRILSKTFYLRLVSRKRADLKSSLLVNCGEVDGKKEHNSKAGSLF